MDPPKSPSLKSRKRKAATQSIVMNKEPMHITDISGDVCPLSPKLTATQKKKQTKKKTKPEADITEKFPIFKNEQLKQKFMSVPMNNNQKGRIRQAIRDSLVGTANVLIPNIIHGKIQDILATSENLSDAQLRRIRILYNLLKTAIKNRDNIVIKKKPKNKSVTKTEPNNPSATVSGSASPTKKKKRYVVFLGNLPLDVNKEQILEHFKEMNEHIMDIRIPKIKEDKKSAIAYMELTNEASYEFALSKHHSMMKKKRINVLYTTQKNGKITKAKAKSKSAKLIALGKEGKLMGSVPLTRKRSQRRAKRKLAQSATNALM